MCNVCFIIWNIHQNNVTKFQILWMKLAFYFLRLQCKYSFPKSIVEFINNHQSFHWRMEQFYFGRKIHQDTSPGKPKDIASKSKSFECAVYTQLPSLYTSNQISSVRWLTRSKPSDPKIRSTDQYRLKKNKIISKNCRQSTMMKLLLFDWWTVTK